MGLGGSYSWRNRRRNVGSNSGNRDEGNQGSTRPPAGTGGRPRGGTSSGGNTGRFDNPRYESYMRTVQPAVFTREGMGGYEDAMYMGATGGIPGYGAAVNPNYGGGGGGGYGGGGGGGGAPALTQATIDAMLQALGATPGALTLQQYNAPAFQGQNIAAFNPQMYTDLSNQLKAAQATDLANVQQGQQNVSNTLRQNYSNAYAQQPVAQAPQQQASSGLLSTVGGDTGAVQGAVQQGNAAAQGGQAGFQNLMNVLAAADQQSQSSRMNQVAMDANYARQNIGAQATGLQGTIGMARNQAQQQWTQQDQERRYQNNLMAQQWAREQAMNNTGVANTQATTNYQQQQTNLQARLQPLLDLIAQGNGVSGLNMSGIQQLLARLTGAG